MAGVFKLLVDILGDVDVTTVDWLKLIELRSALLKVPSNFYKKNPGKSVKMAINASEGPGLSIKYRTFSGEPDSQAPHQQAASL